MKKFKTFMLLPLFIAFSLQTKGAELIPTNDAESNIHHPTSFCSTILDIDDVLYTTLVYLELKDFVQLSNLSKTTHKSINIFFERKEKEAQEIYEKLAGSMNPEEFKGHFTRLANLASFSPTALSYSTKLFQDLGIYETDGDIQVRAKFLGLANIDPATLLTFPNSFPVNLNTLLQSSKKFGVDTTQTLDILTPLPIKRSIKNLNIFFEQTFNMPESQDIELSFENVKIRMNRSIFRPKNSTLPLVNISLNGIISLLTDIRGTRIETNGNIIAHEVINTDNELIFRAGRDIYIYELNASGNTSRTGKHIKLIGSTPLDNVIITEEFPNIIHIPPWDHLIIAVNEAFPNAAPEHTITSISPEVLSTFKDSCDIIFSGNVKFKEKL